MKQGNMGDSHMEAVTEVGNKEDEQKELAAKDFGAEVKRLRNRIRMSQTRLGALIGVEQTIMTRIEAGTYGITLDLVSRLAEALHEDRHRLANIYWGVMPEDKKDPNKELLDAIWNLLANYYQPQPPALTTDNRTPRNAEAYEGVERAKVTNKNRKPKDNQPATLPNPEDNEDITKPL